MAVHAARQMAASSRRPAARHGDPILASKITAPNVPGWALQRPRVTTLITQGIRWCPLTVVTGPPGAGKTMALALWAAAGPEPVAWVTLDRYDNRPGVFWSYVVAALRKSGVALPRALSTAARGQTAEHLFLLRLASALAAQDPPVTLAVDDFHLLTEPRLRNGLDFLLRNAGAGLRVAVASQADPPLPLHRYRLAGELTEIRAGDLAFTAAEAGQLLTRHGCTLSPGALDCLLRQTEGWAAGVRLAAISLAARHDADQFVGQLVTEDSALTGYLVHEVLDAQPREAREVLLKVSILEHVNAEVATELTGNRAAGRILAALAHANAFVQPIEDGYRFHTLFADMLRRRLRLESPDQVPALHRRAARWYEQNGRLTDAVRHAAQASDWPLAARMVIDGLAIGEIIDPRGGGCLADAFAGMPYGEGWTEPQPHLVWAAIALSAGRPESAATALGASETTFDRLPAGQQDAARLAAAMIRLAAARRAGDHAAAVEAVARARALVSRIPGDEGVRHHGIRARMLAAHGIAELWSGHFDEAARVLDSGVTAAAASGEERIRIDCVGHLALAEALRGRLGRAAELACQATAAGPGDGRPRQEQGPSPAALAALAWVNLERHELRKERSALKQVDAALGMSPDRLVGTVACLVAAWDSLAEGRAAAAAQFVARARSGGSVPAWLEQRLNLAESWALASAGDIEAALAAAKRADCDSSPGAAVTLARAWVAAGDGDNARAALAPVLSAREGVPDRVRLQACLVAAQVSYRSGDRARGRRSLGHALRLAEREEVRLPFAVERGWIASALQRDPEWAGAHQDLVALVMPYARRPARPHGPDEALIPESEPLTERELQVLRHVSGMLTTAEIASELYISTNTVKSHIKHICHKLAASHRGEAVRRARQLQLI